MNQSPPLPPSEALPSDTPLPATDVAVARQPILDRRSGIFGYELVDRSGTPPGPQRDAALLSHALALSEHQATAERRVLLVCCDPATASSGDLDGIDPGRVVLEFTVPRGAAPEWIAQTAEALRNLRQRGFRIALPHQVLATAWRDWLEQARFIKLDLARLPAAAVPAVLKAARAQPGMRLIACGIETAQQQRQAAELGIELFQGPWYATPAPPKNAAMRPGQATVLELIGLLRREAGPFEIEEVLKRDPALSFNLLRYLNSPGMGLPAEVTSFRHAVMMLGMERLLRWACLLMTNSQNGASPAVGQTAVVRGRLMELLAAEMLPPEACDHAFVVGVFSLLDTMTGVPLAKALDGVLLPEPVLEALLHRRGLFAPFLELTEACESANDEVFARTANALSLSNHQVNMAHLQALAWAEDLQA